MVWIWAVLSILIALTGLRYRQRIERSPRPGDPPRVDDDALRRILEEGTLSVPDAEPLDMDEASRAEEDFWGETWDEPEEYSR
jgi:hypothetical protein